MPVDRIDTRYFDANKLTTKNVRFFAAIHLLLKLESHAPLITERELKRTSLSLFCFGQTIDQNNIL